MSTVKSSNPILFLDHDGVICFGNVWGSRFTKQLGDDPRDYLFDISHPIVDLRFDDFDSDAVHALNYIINETDCEIVVTSDWRTYATLEEMGTYYLAQGVIKKPIAFTPFVENFVPHRVDHSNLEHNRIMEIKRWILENGMPSKWAVVDDLDMSASGLNFVQAYEFNGITDSHVKKDILKYLK